MCTGMSRYERAELKICLWEHIQAVLLRVFVSILNSVGERVPWYGYVHSSLQANASV